MPPRRRVDSLNTQGERRYNLRPRTRVVQSSSHGSIARDIHDTSSISQQQMRYTQRSRVRCATPRVRSSQPMHLHDPTSIEYMYDQCDQVFYTPERCIHNSDIPCYTVNNNDILINEDYIRPRRPRNSRYINGIRHITSLSDEYINNVRSISSCSNDYTSVIPNITTLSNRHTPMPTHRTPPRTLIDALYYAFDDIIQPIKTYITSTQLICVIVMHVILTISIYWRLYSTSFSFCKHITTPPYYWLYLFLFYIPMQWDFLFVYFLLNMLYHVVILVLYLIYQVIYKVYHCIYRNICSRVNDHMNTYVIPFVLRCYLWIYIQKPSYVPLPIREYIDFIMAPRTRSLTRANPDDPNNPNDDILYQNPNPRRIRHALTNGMSETHDEMDDTVDDTLIDQRDEDEDDRQNISSNRIDNAVIPSSTSNVPLRNEDIPQLINTLVNQAMRNSRNELNNDIRNQLNDITNAVRDTQRQQAEMKQLSNMLLQSSSAIPHRNSITMPRQSDVTHETRTTNYVQISTPPHEPQRSPNTQTTPYVTPMTTYTIPLERISLQQDEPVNIRTMHTRASALPTHSEFEAFASLSPQATTKRATSAFLDRVLKYLQFDKQDSELIAEARALTLLAQHLTWAELATELKSYADTNQEFTYSKDLFWRKKRDLYSSKFQSHYAQRQDIGSVLRDAISRNQNHDNNDNIHRDNTDEESVYDVQNTRSRNSNNNNRNNDNNRRNNNRNNNYNGGNNRNTNQYNNNNQHNNRNHYQNEQNTNNSRSSNNQNNSYNSNESRNSNPNNGNRNNNNNFRRNNNSYNNNNRRYNDNNQSNNNNFSNNSNQQSIPSSSMPQYPQRYMNNQYMPMDIPQMQHVIPSNMYPQYQCISTPAMHPQPMPQIQSNIPNQNQNSQPENMTFQ